MRTAFYKYFHPKEALIEQGILHNEVSRVALDRPREDRRRKNPRSFITNVAGPREEEIFH